MSANGRADRAAGGSRNQEDRAIRPRYRRAFGCVTWFYMAVLVLLGFTFAFAYPLTFFGHEGTYTEILSRITLFAGITFIPSIAFAAFVGSRTYRVEKARARKTGAGIGAILGLICFLFLDLDGWESIFRLNWPGGVATFFVPVSLVAIGLILYALATKGDYARQRLIVFVAAGITVVAGALVVALEPGLPNVAGSLVGIAAGALAGWVGGLGYARAGGDEMIPPGATIVRRGPSGRK